MKYIASIFAILAISLCAQGGTIKFGNGSASALIGPNGSLISTSDTFTIELYFLGNATSGTLVSDIDDATKIGTLTGVKGTNTKAGAGAGLFAALNFDFVDAERNANDRVFLRIVSGDYYLDIFNVAVGADVTAADGFALGTIELGVDQVFTWVAGSYGAGSPDVDNAGKSGMWVAVPEPATAALAVAGLALLFKRRRK